jgi:hypothetical protein
LAAGVPIEEEAEETDPNTRYNADNPINLSNPNNPNNLNKISN